MTEVFGSNLPRYIKDDPSDLNATLLLYINRETQSIYRKYLPPSTILHRYDAAAG